MYKICLDAAHSDKPKENSREDEIGNTVCNLIQKLLFNYNGFAPVVVPVVNKNGVHLDLMWKTKFANDMKADAYISIHCNWAENKNANGFNIFYNDIETARDKELAKKSKRLATLISGQMQEHGFTFWGVEDILPDTRASVGNLAVCSYTLMPAVLIELCFLSNEIDTIMIEKREIQEKYAVSIAKGVTSFFV